MKLFTLCVLAAALPLFGGKLIEMDSTDLSSNQTTMRRMMLENDRLAIVDGRSKIIFLADGGRTRIQVVDLQRNEYMEIDEAAMKQIAGTMAGVSAQMEAAMKGLDPQTKAMMEKMMKGKMPAAAPAAAAPITFARQGDATVAGYSCTRYRGTQGGQTVLDACASTAAALKMEAGDYAIFEKMREFAAGMQEAVRNSPFGGALVANGAMVGGYEGFPVEQTVYVNGKAASKDTLKSIKDQSFSDADFSVGNAKKNDPFAGMKGKGR